MTVLLPILMYRSIHKFDIEFARVQIILGYFVVRPSLTALTSSIDARRVRGSFIPVSSPSHMFALYSLSTHPVALVIVKTVPLMLLLYSPR